MAWLRDKEAKKTLAVPILGWPSVFLLSGPYCPSMERNSMEAARMSHTKGKL